MSICNFKFEVYYFIFYFFAFLSFVSVEEEEPVQTGLFARRKKASLSNNTTWNDCPLIVVSKTIFHGCDTIVVLFLFPCLSLTKVQKREKNVLIIKK